MAWPVLFFLQSIWVEPIFWWTLKTWSFHLTLVSYVNSFHLLVSYVRLTGKVNLLFYGQAYPFPRGLALLHLWIWTGLFLGSEEMIWKQSDKQIFIIGHCYHIRQCNIRGVYKANVYSLCCSFVKWIRTCRAGFSKLRNWSSEKANGLPSYYDLLVSKSCVIALWLWLLPAFSFCFFFLLNGIFIFSLRI